MYIWQHIANLYYRTAKWMFTCFCDFFFFFFFLLSTFLERKFVPPLVGAELRHWDSLNLYFEHRLEIPDKPGSVLYLAFTFKITRLSALYCLVLGQSVIELSVAQGEVNWHDLWPLPLTYWPENYWVISCTRLRATDRQVQSNMSSFFKGGGGHKKDLY